MQIAQLTEAAGSEDSISRGRYIALGIVVVGLLGAVGSAMRPLYRHQFRHTGPAVVRSAASARRARDFSAEDQEKLNCARLRLAELQERQRLRHPALHGSVAKVAGVSKGTLL